jgi:hypothetical protein
MCPANASETSGGSREWPYSTGSRTARGKGGGGRSLSHKDDGDDRRLDEFASKGTSSGLAADLRYPLLDKGTKLVRPIWGLT